MSCKSNMAFNLSVAQECTGVDPDRCFIFACEHKARDKIVRHYHCVKDFEWFLQRRDNYPHCHELLTNHLGADENTRGRLVFDFDIPISSKMPENFCNVIQVTIIRTFRRYYDSSINKKMFEYVWSSSSNSSKYSYHLTVKNCHFENWSLQSKDFYLLFLNTWNSMGYELPGEDLLDAQIIRKNASLRMVGSKKISGKRLKLCNPEKYCLADAMIRVYIDEDKAVEQLIVINSLNRTGIELLKKLKPEVHSKKKYASTKNTMQQQEGSIFPSDVEYNAFKLVDSRQPGIFKLDMSTNKNIKEKRGHTGKFIRLMRLQSKECIISSKVHDNDNAAIMITKEIDHYAVYFYCYRGCSYRPQYIGSVDL